MKNNVRKLLAVFLSALMLATSVPFTAFAAEDTNLKSLKDEIAAYEAKMDGTVYVNMKDAYNAYVKSKEVEYAYEYGNRTDIDLLKYADDLASKSALMTKWDGIEVESPSFNYGSIVPSDYVSNILFATAPQVFGGYSKEAFIYKFLMPQNVVFLYNGSDLKLPVMLAAHNDGGFGGNDRVPLSFFANDNTKDSMNDNEYFQLHTFWKGSKEIVKSGGPSLVSDFNWDEAFSSTRGYKIDDVPGFNNESNNGVAEGYKHEKGHYQETNNGNKWLEYVNTLYYQHNAADNNWNNRLQTITLSWTGRSMRWTSVWTTSNEDYHYYYGSADNNNRFNANFYVIDYRGAEEAINKFSSDNLNFNNSFLKYELNDYLEAIRYLQEEPTEGFTNETYSERARELSSGIESCINKLNNGVSELDMSAYDNLAEKLSEYKAIYDSNNSDVTYTADSYSAFKSAYDASVSEAAAVADNGFTSVKTAAALETAYKNLNKVIKPSGESGTTTYAFDEETGTVTITGPGAMADYDSAEDSPFGNNDNITKIVIEDGVTNIGTNTFNNCRNLREITVPASLTYSENAFADCPKLETVYITGGAVNNESAANAPWNLSSVERVHLGTDKEDMSVDSVGTSVFVGCVNKAFYVYNSECDIPDERVSTFGNNPTIYCYVPSTAYYFAKDYSLVYKSLGHVHSWEVLQVVAPTCKTGGYTVYKCKYDDFCSETKRDDEVAALGHDLELTESVPATCTENGYDLYSCSRCDYTTKKNATKKTSHSFTGTAEPAYSSGSTDTSNQFKHRIACANDCGTFKEEYCSFEIADKVTIGDDVFTVFKCPVCQGTYYVKSDVKADEFEVFFVGSDNKIIDTVIVKKDGTVPSDKIPAFPQNVGHEYKWQLNGADSNPATVIINETKIFQLVDTPKTYTVTFINIDGATLDTQYVAHGSKPENIVPLDNDEAEQLPNGNPEQDSKHYILAWNDDLNPADVVITDDTVFNVVKKAVPHNFTDTEIEKPTCTSTGVVSKYCEDCEFFIPEAEVPMTEHTPEVVKGKAATCADSGLTDGSVCKVCGTELVKQKIIKATGKHTWNKGVKSADGKKIVYKCSVCQKTKTEDVPQNTTPSTPASPYAAITPSDKVANAAPVNKSIKRPKKVRTTSLSKKKQMRVRFGAIKGAQNYRVMFRKAGTKTWSYAWTDGKTEYYLKNLKNGGLYEFCFAAYKKNSKGQWERGNYSKITRRYYYKHALKKYNGKNGTITLKWKKKKGASAYQIQYSTKKSMAGAKTITINNPNTTSYKITGLKKGKKYYVRVRANKKYKKKKFTGEFSKRRKVKA